MQQFWVCLVLAFLLPGSGRGLDNGLARTPPMGWNSWNHFDCLIDERTVRETADALVRSGLADLGYVYLNIDDCWAEMERDSKGSLQARAATFPSGIKALADYAHQRGLKLGIYSDAGFHTCGGQPGSLGFEHQDAGLFGAWGVDYLKYDNCHTDGSRPEERYPVMQAALNKTGRPILFSLCEWGVDDPATWAAQVGNTWRTTADIKDRWDRVVAVADENDRWAESAGPGGWNDPDMLEVGNGGMSAEEYRAHFSLWALMKAPLLVGADVRNLSREYLDILGNKEVIGVNQDPLGVQGKKVVSSDAGMEVWAGPLAQGKWAVLLWNRSPQPALMSVDWKEIPGLNNTSKIAPPAVRDLWKHEDLGQLTRIQATVPSHGVKMYTVTSSRSI